MMKIKVFSEVEKYSKPKPVVKVGSGNTSYTSKYHYSTSTKTTVSYSGSTPRSFHETPVKAGDITFHVVDKETLSKWELSGKGKEYSLFMSTGWVDPDIWKTGFRGEILVFPISSMWNDDLKFEEIEDTIRGALERHKDGKVFISLSDYYAGPDRLIITAAMIIAAKEGNKDLLKKTSERLKIKDGLKDKRSLEFFSQLFGDYGKEESKEEEEEEEDYEFCDFCHSSVPLDELHVYGISDPGATGTLLCNECYEFFVNLDGDIEPVEVGDVYQVCDLCGFFVPAERSYNIKWNGVSVVACKSCIEENGEGD